ncbi:PLP-dependent cysteine synthase family protein [Geoalkalibacter subterraneus]|jgi:cysteine synthase B|uniref:PLP-dependent cysteine synthase family protein n=1 Tax=Geoalkalibacter subterraneus TaxID=483547 RepID=UPI0006937FA8|nr:cysteine synthase family protein [Geoalkalibacter subterraneus]
MVSSDLTPRTDNNLCAAIGNTPLVALEHLSPNPGVRILAKLEGGNPGGSVKDRPAWYMIKKAEESGDLVREKIILEPTSGNTGIALAMIAAARQYRIKLVMPACVSLERRQILEAYGAELVLSPPDEGTDGAIRLAHQIFQEDPERYYMPNQYANPNNVLAHYETTGPEIWQQTDGRVDAFVAGMGTSGTLMGVGAFLRERNPEVLVVGVEPVLGHKVQGLKNMQEAIVPEIYRPRALDRKLTIDDDEAFETARQLALREGVLAGMSSGAAVAGAVRVAAELDHGVVVTLLPDRGDRYLSTTLFRARCAKCLP